MMYFESRAQAGRLLADQLEHKYKDTNSVIMSLSDGGVMVGAIIASRIHAALTLLLTAQIDLPREPDPLAVIDQEGGFTYNNMIPAGVLEEMVSEYRNFIEEEKLTQMHKMSRLLGGEGLMQRSLLHDRDVILVSDGLSNGFSLEAAVGYLKPVRTRSIVIATPVASVQAVDRMHVLTDEICCLSIPENYISTNHYYTADDIVDSRQLLEIIKQSSAPKV